MADEPWKEYQKQPDADESGPWDDYKQPAQEEPPAVAVAPSLTPVIEPGREVSYEQAGGVLPFFGHKLLHPLKAAETGIEQFAIQTGMAEPGSRLLWSPTRQAQTPVAAIPQIPKQEGKLAQIGAGAVNAVTDFLNFFQTPEGVATLGIGSLPALARKYVLANFATQMATAAPQQLTAAVEQAKAGNYQEATKQALSGAGGVILTTALAKGVGAPEALHPSVTLPASMRALAETQPRVEAPQEMLQEPLPSITPEGVEIQPQPSTPEVPSASSLQSSEKLHESLPSQSIGGEQAVPAEVSGEGVQLRTPRGEESPRISETARTGEIPLTPDDIGWNRETPESEAFRAITPDEANSPEALSRILTADAQVDRTGAQAPPESTTKRVTALLDNETGKVELVSTYRTGRGAVRILDPRRHDVGAVRPHVALDTLLDAKTEAGKPRFKPLYSILLDEPVQKFRQSFANEGEFRAAFAEPAETQRLANQKYREGAAVPVEGTPEVPGALTVEEPITDVEAAAVYEHVLSEVGKLTEASDVSNAVLALKEKAASNKLTPRDYQIINGLRKLVERTEANNPELRGSDEAISQTEREIFEHAQAAADAKDFAKRVSMAEKPVPRSETPGATAEPAPASAVESAIQKLEEAANRAKQRIDSRSGLKFGAGPDPIQTARDVADWAIVGAAKLARGGYDLARWSREMVAEIGEKIQPYLENVYRQASRMAAKLSQQVEAERTDIGRILSSGAEMREQEQASFGAALLQEIIKEKGSVDVQQWYDGMAKEFGEDVRSEAKLERLYNESRDLMSEGVPIPAGPRPTPFTTGQRRITVGERTALREVLRKAEEAGAAGRRAGAEAKAEQLAPVIADLESKLSDSISKAQALGEYLRGQETGARLSGEAARLQAQRIDRWLTADVDTIRQSLLQLARALPPSDRAAFLSAITNALKRPPIFSAKAVELMYRRAATVASRIENRIGEVEIRDLSKEVRDFKRWGESPSVDVRYRQRIRAELERFNQLMKGDGLDKDAITALRDRLVSLRDIGRSEQTVKKAIWEWQKEFAERQLQEQPTRPVETRPEIRPIPGEKLTVRQKIRNWVNQKTNSAAMVDKALLPIDALFDLMESAKGTYNGWLFRHARGPIDLAYNLAVNRRNALVKRFEQFVKDTKLTPENAERIGVYAQSLQEGGRQRLIDAGLTPERIDQIAGSLTRNELAAYRLMRRVMDSQLPGIQKLMRELYNTEVKPVQNYFPMPRDWRVFEPEPADPKAPGAAASYDELATWKALRDDFVPPDTTQTKKGFTLERQKGAKTPIRIDAFDIFRQHIQDVSYLQEMQRNLKALGEIGRGDLFRAKYGDVGRDMFLDWLDTVARQGRSENFKRWRWLDTMRKNTSVGVIGFRLSSQLVHLSNAPYIVARIGKWFGNGLFEAATERGKKFIADNFAETAERGGGEPAQVEVEKEGARLFGVTIVPPKIVRASYALARGVDRMNSQGAALGTYLKLLNDKGVDWRKYDTLPIDREAQAKALVLARRAIASPLAKDVPQAIQRGALTGGNVSLGRSLFQFQNIFLDQWSNIRHDLFQAGFRERNPKLAAQMAVAITTAILLEVGIKQGSKEVIQQVTGYQPKKKKDEFTYKVLHETLRRFPFGGQAMGMTEGRSGIPIVDALVNEAKNLKQVYAAKKPAAQEKAVIRSLGGLGQLIGIPGSSQGAELLEKSLY